MSVWQFPRLSAWNPETPLSILWKPNHIFFYKPYHVPEGHHHWSFWHRMLFRSLSWCFGMLPQQMKRFLQKPLSRNCLCTVEINDEKWQLNGQCLWDGKYRITTIVAALRFLYSPNPAQLHTSFCPFLLPPCHLLSLVLPFYVLFAAHNVVSTSSILLQQRKKT